MRTPLLNVKRDVEGEKRQRRRLLLAGLGVFVASVILTVGVFLAMRADETSRARQTFYANGDDLATRLVSGVYSNQRRVRVISTSMRLLVESGEFPSRQWFDDAASRLRVSSNSFVRLSFTPFIEASQRAGFEAAMSREAGRPITIFNAINGQPASNASVFAPLMYTNFGTEPVSGPSYLNVGFSWGQWYPSVRDLIIRATMSGRALSSEPLVLDHQGYLITLTPVFLRPEIPWYVNATGSPNIPLMYCSPTGACPLTYSRDPPDPRASFVVSGLQNNVPKFGLVKEVARLEEMSDKSEVVPLCVPTLPFTAGTDYNRFTNTTADPDPQGPCNKTRREQELEAQVSPFLMFRRPVSFFGFISFITNPAVFIAGLLSSHAAKTSILFAAEEVSDSDAWPLTLRVYSPDSWVTALASEGWQQQVIRDGKVPTPPLPRAGEGNKEATSIKTIDGKELRFLPSALSPYVWAVAEGPPFPSPGGRFGLALDSSYLKRGVKGPCINASVGNASDAYVTVCPPAISAQEYLERSKHSHFKRSFIGLVGSRLWRVEVASLEPYYVDHTNSRNALIGGLLLSAVLVVIVVSVLSARNEQIRKRQQKAAEGAHTLVVDYCVSEVKHCNAGLVLQLDSLQKRLPVLAQADKELSETAVALARGARTAPRQNLLVEDEAEEEEGTLALRAEQEAVATQLRTAKAQLLGLHAIVSPALAKLSDDVDLVETSAEQLHEISNDFSDYSKLRAGRFDIRHKLVDLRAVINRAVEVCGRSAGTSIRLDVSPLLPSHALIDPLRMQQVLINGLSNAARYSRDITMTVKGLDEGDAVQRLSAVPVPSWYKSNKPDLELLRQQVRCKLYESNHASDAGGRQGWHAVSALGKRVRRKKQVRPCDLASSFVEVGKQLEEHDSTSASRLFAQYLVVEITHTAPVVVSSHHTARPSSEAVALVFSRIRHQQQRSSTVQSGVELVATTAGGSHDSASGTGLLQHRQSSPSSDRTENEQSEPGSQSPLPASTSTPGVRRSKKQSTLRSHENVTLQGTSIGLALSSSLVERMEGWIALHDQPDTAHPDHTSRSTRYSVVLPCWVADKPHEACGGVEGGLAGAMHDNEEREASSPTSQEGGPSPTTNHELSLIDTRVSGRHNLWSAQSQSPLASAQPFAGPSQLAPNTGCHLGHSTAEPIMQRHPFQAGAFLSPASSFDGANAPSPPLMQTTWTSPKARCRPVTEGVTSEAAYAPSPAAAWRSSSFPPASSFPESAAAARPVQLPTAAAARPVQLPTAAAGPPEHTYVGHALVADDDEVNRRLAKRMLQRLHCSCDTIDDVNLAAACFERTAQLQVSASSSAEPIDVLPSGLTDPPRPYDFALFDILCGEGLGWEACQKLRGMGLTSVPIFAMTGNLDASELQKYHDAGMEELVLGKPFTIEALEKVLEAALEKRVVRNRDHGPHAE
jgi:signal transduction histidine kinase